MVDVIGDLSTLPTGSHAISFYASEEEAKRKAISFLKGAAPGQRPMFWVTSSLLQSYYDDEIASEMPNQVGCVGVLPAEQVELSGGKLRPVQPVRQFIQEHPEGVSAGADTISSHWNPETIPAHIEYEKWFNEQPRTRSRFLCPYDIRTIPREKAAEVMRDLAYHHTHVSLSDSDDPGVKLVQVLLFQFAAAVPRELRRALKWAKDEGLIKVEGNRGEISLTTSGSELLIAPM